jgi:hypothetical protein
MRNAVLVLGFTAILAIILLRGCVTIDVRFHTPAWLGGETEQAVHEAIAQNALRGGRRVAGDRERMQKQANLDALVNQAVRIGSDAQAYYLKPAAFGGGDRSFDGISFERMGYFVESDSNFVTIDGMFRLALSPETGVRIVGENETYGSRVIVTVAGPRAADLSTRIESM